MSIPKNMKNENLNIPTTGYVEFAGSPIPFTVVDGVVYVAIKPICEAIGLRPDKAIEVIKNHEILSQLHTLRGVVAGDGKEREMSTLPLSHLNGWLFTIDVNRVNEQAREKLLAYQRECYQALFEHFFGKQEEQVRARELWANLQAMYLRAKDLESTLRLTDLGKELTALRGDIRRAETELSTLQASMMNSGQLKLIG
jgi:hypothetical protein